MMDADDNRLERVYCTDCQWECVIRWRGEIYGLARLTNFCPACGSEDVEISFPSEETSSI